MMKALFKKARQNVEKKNSIHSKQTTDEKNVVFELGDQVDAYAQREVSRK